jgi:hypothetical protein
VQLWNKKNLDKRAIDQLTTHKCLLAALKMCAEGLCVQVAGGDRQEEAPKSVDAHAAGCAAATPQGCGDREAVCYQEGTPPSSMCGLQGKCPAPPPAAPVLAQTLRHRVLPAYLLSAQLTSDTSTAVQRSTPPTPFQAGKWLLLIALLSVRCQVTKAKPQMHCRPAMRHTGCNNAPAMASFSSCSLCSSPC